MLLSLDCCWLLLVFPYPISPLLLRSTSTCRFIRLLAKIAVIIFGTIVEGQDRAPGTMTPSIISFEFDNDHPNSFCFSPNFYADP